MESGELVPLKSFWVGKKTYEGKNVIWAPLQGCNSAELYKEDKVAPAELGQSKLSYRHSELEGRKANLLTDMQS